MGFLDTIWGVKPYVKNSSYMFNWAQLGIFMGIMAFCIFFSMWFFKREENKQKRFLIIATVLLFLFEAGRITFNYFILKDNKLDISFLSVVDLSLFTLSVWISIPIMLFVAIKGYRGKLSQTLLTFVFSVTAVFALFDIIYPVGINTGFSLFHLYNLIFLFSHAIVLLIALFLGATPWLDNTIDDIWKALFCLLFIAGICVALYYASGKTFDPAFLEGCPIFEQMGLHDIPPQWHVGLLGAFFFCCQVIVYLPFSIYRKIKYRKRPQGYLDN